VCVFITLSGLVSTLLVDESTMSLGTVDVHGLEPGTLYKFYAVSLTVAGPSYENSSIVEAITEDAGLHAGVYALIGIGVFIVLLFGVIGAVACVR